MMERLLDTWEAVVRRPPWDWPKGARVGCWLGVFVLGAMMAVPVWLHDWDAWQARRDAWTQQRALQEAVVQLRQQTTALPRRLQPNGATKEGLLALLEGTSTVAHDGLTWFGLDGPSPVTPMPMPSKANASSAGVAVHFWTARLQMEDRFLHWLSWWQQGHRGALGGRIAALDIQALADDRVRVRLTVSQPVFDDMGGDGDARHRHVGGGRSPEAHAVKPSPHDPFDHRVTASDVTQPQRLEQQALAQLRYVGRLHNDARDQVLLRAPGGRGANPAQPLQAVSVGDGLGPHLGRLGAVSDAAVQIDGTWQDARGVWRAQSLRLDFDGETP